MKIVFIVSALHGGGAERVVSSLASQMYKMGHDVRILMIAGSECVYELPEGVRVISLASESKGNPLIKIKRIAALRKYYKELNREGDRPLTSDGDRPRFFAFSTTINMQAIIAALGLKVRLTVSERNDPERYDHKSLRNFLYQIGAKRGTRFVFQTKEAMDCFGAYPEIIRNSRIIGNPLREDIPENYYIADPENYRGTAKNYRGTDPENPTDSEKSKIISAIGRLEEQKNYPLLLKAFAIFHKKHPGYELHIYGKGKLLENLKEMASTLKIDRFVIFEGFRSDALKEAAKSDIFALTSSYEGMPNALMEGMAMGLPCVSADCPAGGPGMLIENGVNGILVPMGNEDDMIRDFADAFDKLADDPGFAATIGSNARNIRKLYNVERIAAEWLKSDAK